MTSEQFQREMDFGVTMALVREMLDSGLITLAEFSKIEKLYIQKHDPIYQFAGAWKAGEPRQDS